MITGKNEAKISTKFTSCGCKWKFDGRKCNSNQKCENDKCWWECKKHNILEKIIFGIPLHLVVKIENI